MKIYPGVLHDEVAEKVSTIVNRDLKNTLPV